MSNAGNSKFPTRLITPKLWNSSYQGQRRIFKGTQRGEKSQWKESKFFVVWGKEKGKCKVRHREECWMVQPLRPPACQPVCLRKVNSYHQPQSWEITQERWKCVFTQNVFHTSSQEPFYYHQELETTQTSFNKWTDNPQRTHKMEHDSALDKNELQST